MVLAPAADALISADVFGQLAPQAEVVHVLDVVARLGGEALRRQQFHCAAVPLRRSRPSTCRAARRGCAIRVRQTAPTRRRPWWVRRTTASAGARGAVARRRAACRSGPAPPACSPRHAAHTHTHAVRRRRQRAGASRAQPSRGSWVHAPSRRVSSWFAWPSVPASTDAPHLVMAPWSPRSRDEQYPRIEIRNVRTAQTAEHAHGGGPPPTPHAWGVGSARGPAPSLQKRAGVWGRPAPSAWGATRWFRAWGSLVSRVGSNSGPSTQSVISNGAVEEIKGDGPMECWLGRQ